VTSTSIEPTTTTTTVTGLATTTTQTTTTTASTTSTLLSTLTATETTPGPTTTVTQTVTQTNTTTTTQPPSLTVDSVNQNGQAITGYWNVLRLSGGGQVGGGYTPRTYAGLTPRTYAGLTPSATYTIELDSYGSCQFSHWQDSGSTTDPRSFVATGALTLVGVYDCTGAAAAPAASPHTNGGGSSHPGAQVLAPVSLLLLVAVGATSPLVARTAFVRRARTRIAETIRARM
jgi:hypothetical protein